MPVTTQRTYLGDYRRYRDTTSKLLGGRPRTERLVGHQQSAPDKTKEGGKPGAKKNKDRTPGAKDELEVKEPGSDEKEVEVGAKATHEPARVRVGKAPIDASEPEVIEGRWPDITHPSFNAFLDAFAEVDRVAREASNYPHTSELDPDTIFVRANQLWVHRSPDNRLVLSMPEGEAPSLDVRTPGYGDVTTQRNQLEAAAEVVGVDRVSVTFTSPSSTSDEQERARGNRLLDLRELAMGYRLDSVSEEGERRYVRRLRSTPSGREAREIQYAQERVAFYDGLEKVSPPAFRVILDPADDSLSIQRFRVWDEEHAIQEIEVASFGSNLDDPFESPLDRYSLGRLIEMLESLPQAGKLAIHGDRGEIRLKDGTLTGTVDRNSKEDRQRLRLGGPLWQDGAVGELAKSLMTFASNLGAEVVLDLRDATSRRTKAEHAEFKAQAEAAGFKPGTRDRLVHTPPPPFRWGGPGMYPDEAAY